MQIKLQAAHCDLQSWTPARRSITALVNVLRRSSMLACSPWKRCMFDLSHFSTWATRRSTRRVRCWTRSAAHSESSTCCRELDRSQESRKMDRRCSRSVTGISGPTSKNRASVSSASITRSVSKPCCLQFDGARLEFSRTVPSVAQARDLLRNIRSPRQRARSRGENSRDERP